MSQYTAFIDLLSQQGNQVPIFLPKFKFDMVKVIKVYDGDTYHVVGFQEDCKTFYRYTLRLREINTPELKGPESEAGYYVKEEVAHLILDQIVYISNIGYDKYHRLLASLKFYNSHLDAHMDLATYIKENFMKY